MSLLLELFDQINYLSIELDLLISKFIFFLYTFSKLTSFLITLERYILDVMHQICVHELADTGLSLINLKLVNAWLFIFAGAKEAFVLFHIDIRIDCFDHSVSRYL